MEFSRPEYWSGWPFPSPGDLPNLGIELGSPALQVDSLPAEPQGKPEPYVTIEHLRYAIIYSLDFQDSVRKECKISIFFFQWLHIAIGFLYIGYLHTGLNKYIKSTFICLVLLLKFKVLSAAHTIFDGKR